MAEISIAEFTRVGSKNPQLTSELCQPTAITLHRDIHFLLRLPVVIKNAVFALRMMEITSLLLLPSCFPLGNGACDAGKCAGFLGNINRWKSKTKIAAMC